MIYSDKELRLRVKELKIMNDISYKEVATMLNITSNSFYNWMKEQYSLSCTKKTMLSSIIDKLKE